MSTTIKAITTAGVSLAMLAGAALPALASTGPGSHFYANDVRGTGRFGPTVTGTAQADIATLTARYGRDAAELEEVAAFAHFRLPGLKVLLASPAKREAAASQFGAYLRSTVKEEVRWTSPYRTAFAVPHGSRPTTFGWTQMPDLTRDVLVFSWGSLVMNCGGQPYIPAKPIPLPSKPKACKTAGKGKHAPSCAPCQPGQHLFNVPGVGGMCLCPQTVHVIVSSTRTVSVQVITTVTNTSSTTTSVTYGVCPPKHTCKVKS